MKLMHIFPFLRDPVIRMIVVHWGLGMLLGAITAALILVFDVSGIWTLLKQSDIKWAGILMLVVGFAVTFGGVVSATAVMFNPGRDVWRD